MLTELRNAENIYDFARLIGYQPKAVPYLAIILDDNKKYYTFDIPKKGGGERTIWAPKPKLKALQKSVSELIYECLDEFPEAEKKKSVPSYGYRRGKSCIDNAAFHSGSRYVLNVDIEDFFGSIHIGRVIGILTSDRRFELKPEVAKLIAQIACRDGVLPQGAPTSPIISELIGGVIDARMTKMLAKFGCRYSRYVDDITISTNQREFPAAIASTHHCKQGFRVGSALQREISGLGFSLNPKKTRMSHRAKRQSVTGLVVNAKPSVRSESRERLRAMCNTLFRGEEPFRDNFWVEKKKDQERASRAFLAGRLSYQYHVDHRGNNPEEPFKVRIHSARDRLYAEFLLFDIFYPEKIPNIICEGKTDIQYLKAAIEQTCSHNPMFVRKDEEGNLRIVPKFPKRSNSQTHILGFHPGVPGIAHILHQLADFRKRYAKVRPRYPVVIVVDNDDGLEKVNEKTKKFFGVDLKDAPKNGQFYDLQRGLYVVKLVGGKGADIEAIEDLLEPAVLDVTLGDKSFSAKNGNKTQNFSKSILADHVWKKRKTISFLGFSETLKAIECAFADYGFTG